MEYECNIKKILNLHWSPSNCKSIGLADGNLISDVTIFEKPLKILELRTWLDVWEWAMCERKFQNVVQGSNTELNSNYM